MPYGSIHESFKEMKMKFLLKGKAVAAFEEYRLTSSLPVVRALSIITALFNLLLLIPDLVNLGGITVWPLILFRVLYSLSLFSFVFWCGKLKKSTVRSMTISMFEIAAIIVFLYVFQLYPAQDFLIQLLGVMTIVIVVFLVPNSWINMIAVSLIAAAGFLTHSALSISVIGLSQFAAGAVYLILEIVVCATFSMYLLRTQYREYVAKTELERIYATDPLTKIGNRIRLEEEAQKWLTCCQKDNLPLCLVLLDVDNLKQINDMHGHIVGDTVLYETAQILRAKLRPNDVCVRWGGDEFILLLPCADSQEAKELANDIKNAISEYEFSARIDISCSFGIALMQSGQSLQQLIAQADASMYLAKEHGKNTIEISTAVAHDM